MAAEVIQVCGSALTKTAGLLEAAMEPVAGSAPLFEALPGAPAPQAGCTAHVRACEADILGDGGSAGLSDRHAGSEAMEK